MVVEKLEENARGEWFGVCNTEAGVELVRPLVENDGEWAEYML